MLRRAHNLIAATGFLVFCLATAGVLTLSARASDPWKDKDPQDWDQKDVDKILNDSPWSKQLQFGMGFDGSLSGTTTDVGRTAHPETADPSRGGNPVGPPSVGPSPSMGPVTKITVSWHSSQIIREAMVREKELSGSLPDQARRDLAAKYDEYQIAISGANLRAFGKEGSDSLKAHSYLTTKNTKQKFAPSNVVIQNRPDGTPVAILFLFPKTSATGEPTITPTEKSVEFAAKVGSLPLKVTFDISKMTTKAGPDL
jgi:hypothetical protein